MPCPITLLKQHLNRPSKALQQRCGSASLTGDTQGCRVLCEWIGWQRHLEPLVCVLPSAGPLFILDRAEGELKPQHVLREGDCWETKAPTEGILGEKVLSQDLWCVFCAPLLGALAAGAVISLTCFLEKIQGLEGLRQCSHEMLCLLRQFTQQTLVPQLPC